MLTRLDTFQAEAICSHKTMANTPADKPFSIRSFCCLFTLCIWIFVIHLSGLYLFTRGFLLTRLVLDNKSSCAASPLPEGKGETSCWTEPAFKKSIFIVVDALRFDFIIPLEGQTDPHHHNHLTSIQSVLDKEPQNAVLFQFIADPPTTTLQRLKALTAGTLPTFIDAGSNFAGTAIDEDNLIHQLGVQGRRIAFMGDDTWTKLFPNSFLANQSHPYESFNARDLDTVDNGVNRHLFPYLTKFSDSWDFLVAHYLGVDHAGHRYGPSHPAMGAKLDEMNNVFKRVFDLIDDDTIVFIMGDHGMDLKGDHGGESALEVESALFAYSKKGLTGASTPIGTNRRPNNPLRDVFNQLQTEGLQNVFETKYNGYRTVPQVDLVPTISLLLGIPIPFNNLGSIIPELFYGNVEQLVRASRINAHQILGYIKEYTRQDIGQELSHALPIYQEEFDAAEAAYIKASKAYFASESDWQNVYTMYSRFTRLTLDSCRQIWAQFDDSLMISGLVVLSTSIVCLALHAARPVSLLQSNEHAVYAIIIGAISGAALGAFGIVTAWIHTVATSSTTQITDGIVLGLAQGSILAFLVQSCWSLGPWHLFKFVQKPTFDGAIALAMLLTHLALFGSNSYTVWEDFAIAALAQTFGFLALLQSFRVNDPHLRRRLMFFSVVFIALVRLSHYSTICREEQVPYCEPTFYASAGSSTASLYSLALLIFFVGIVPSIVQRTLEITASFTGAAEVWVAYGLRVVLIMVGVYWTFDLLEDSKGAGIIYLGPNDLAKMKYVKIYLARAVMFATTMLAIPVWATSPLCLSTKTVEQMDSDKTTRPQSVTTVASPTRRLYIFGFANTFGSAYLLLFLAFYALVMLVYKPMGGIMTSILLMQILCFLEIIDTKRDVMVASLAEKAGTTLNAIQQTNIPGKLLADYYPSFSEVVVLALLGSLSFYSTGHQAVLSSIDWNAAFVGFETDVYPFAPILVILNTLGAHILAALALPFLSLWKVSPQADPQQPLFSHLTRTIMMFAMYHAAVTTSASAFAAYFRRHLMVWKVFAPRFMLGGITLLAVDIVVAFLALGLGSGVVLEAVNRVFRFGYQ